MSTGLHLNLDERTYHAHQGSLSVTGAKTLLRCPALFKWQQDNPVHKDVFDFGSAAHSLVLGTGPQVDPVSADSWRTKEAQEHRDRIRAEGRIPVLWKEWEVVQAMADKLSTHTLAMRLLSQGDPEVSAFCEDEETGVMRRARFDWLGPRWVTDYKTAASVDPRDLAGRYGSVSKWGYANQAAWYTDIARDLGRTVDSFAFIFQSKEPPFLVTVATIPDDELSDARRQNREAMERFRDCSASGIWPGYLRDDAYAVLSLDSQTYLEQVV